MELKKQIKTIDLAVSVGKAKQNTRTGFLHYFPGEDAAVEIPLYENFCFALALFRQKTAESILEGKAIVERLLAFQTEEGNFPVYLHDFPHCSDFHQSLKIAPILFHILRGFSSVLPSEYKEKVAKALQKAIRAPKSSKWEHRYLALKGEKVPSFLPETGEDWFQWIISLQLQQEHLELAIPFNTRMQVFLGGSREQEKGEPKPLPIEYILAEKQDAFHGRLQRMHMSQLYAAALYPFSSSELDDAPMFSKEGFLLWFGKELHSLVSSSGSFVFALPPEVDVGRNDLFEAAIYTNISSETSLWINGEKGMVFHFGDVISICTKERTVHLTFTLLEGQGQFCGHISRANRSSQMACHGSLRYEAYDWQIGMRTLRRQGACKISVQASFS